MGTMTSQITSLTIVYSTVYSGTDQRKHQSFASQAFVRGIHRGPVNSPHKWPVTRKMFPFDDVIMSLAVWARFICVVSGFVWAENDAKPNQACKQSTNSSYGSVQDWSISSALAMVIKQSCAKPSIDNLTGCLMSMGFIELILGWINTIHQWFALFNHHCASIWWTILVFRHIFPIASVFVNDTENKTFKFVLMRRISTRPGDNWATELISSLRPDEVCIRK